VQITVAQRSIEILIGRLITDEAFRNTFRHQPYAAIGAFMLAGHDLTAIEISAVTATPCELWELVAEQIDGRIQKVSLSLIGC
jgi:hypothetical protein